MHILYRKHQIIACILLLIFFAILETWTNIDISIQQYFYNIDSGNWFITKMFHNEWKLFLYTMPKILLILLGIGCLFGVIVSFLKPQKQFLRYPCLLLILSIAITPLTVSIWKKATNIYCPKELILFGGKEQYNRLLKSTQKKETSQSGNAFPAGHASGGFALMALYFCKRSKVSSFLGVTIGITTGWLMGIYQMLRGEHFFSHTLTTMVVSWIIILMLTAMLQKMESSYTQVKRQVI